MAGPAALGHLVRPRLVGLHCALRRHRPTCGRTDELDSELTTGSTWAIAHGQFSCAFPSNSLSVAPLYPMVSGGLAAVARVGHARAVPLGRCPGPLMRQGAHSGRHVVGPRDALPGTLRIAYIAWVVLLVGIVALLRASERGRCGWEPATLVVVATLPPVWMCVAGYFHPQDLFAMGLALGLWPVLSVTSGSGPASSSPSRSSPNSSQHSSRSRCSLWHRRDAGSISSSPFWSRLSL